VTAIAFFAHDENDAAVLRRVRAFKASGYDVVGFAMRRGERNPGSWAKVDLGQSYDGRLFHRMGRVAGSAKTAAAHRECLESCDIIYARNLDMLLCARWALQKARLKKPIIYECLDIHRLMHRRDIVGLLMRRIEWLLLRETALLVVSSPAFLREYFDRHHRNVYSACLVENRIAQHQALGSQPTPDPSVAMTDRPLRIGWFGVLRCRRSLALLEALAERCAGRVEIVMHGYADIVLPDFDARIARQENMHYGGRYRSPEDLAKIYSEVDLIWAGDFHDAGFNSRWLLPNRIYEGGYFGVPAIAPADSETGRWLEAHRAGFTLAEPLESTLCALIDQLLLRREEIAARRSGLSELPASTFIQPDGEMRSVVEKALSNETCVDAKRVALAKSIQI
jgi:succinoglycan biosynthesis protein ExoL